MKITFRFFTSIVFLFIFFLLSCSEKEEDVTIPRSTPEAEGISSEAIITFIDSANASVSTEFHSFMILRHGKVVAEGWWDPMAPDLKHTLYSTSKSFTSTAVGIAIAENKLNLGDKIVSFFPELLPDTVSSFLADMEIRDLLSMSTGQRREPPTTTSNWIKSFLETPVENEPGTKYRYSSLASFMLSAIVQKVTNEKVVDYLTPRLFEPLNIEGFDWETNPQDINTGGWGLRLKTEDLAKLGLLYLQKGNWNGKQILTEEWVEEATSLKIYQNPNLTEEERMAADDSQQGYCYQFWRAKNNSYQANGAYGQFILVMPDKNAIVVLTAESHDMWGELDMVWKYIYPGIEDQPLPENKRALSELYARIDNLTLPVPPKNMNEEMMAQISGKTYGLAENQLQIQDITLQFRENKCFLNLKMDSVSFEMVFGSGNWNFGETGMHGPNLFTRAKNNLNGLPPFKIAGAYTWKEDQSLELTLRYLSMHTRKFVFRFNADKVMVEIVDSNSSRFRPPPIEGVITD